MKQVIVIIAVLLMGYAASAQTATTRGWSQSSNGLDTITNAGTTIMYQPETTYFSGNEGTFSVAFKFLKGTGTPAGYAILQESPDGYNWVNFTNSATDSFALSNVDSAVHVWHVTGSKVTNIRVKAVGSGTQVTGTRVYYKKN